MKPTKKILSVVVYLACAFILSSGSLFALEAWDKVAGQVDREKQRAEKDAAVTVGLVKQDKAGLTAEVTKLKSEAGAGEAALERLKSEFETLSKAEEVLNAELAQEHQEVEEVEGTVRSSVKEAESMVRDNPITAEFPQRLSVISDLMDTRKFPGLEGIQSLISLFFGEMEATGTITRRTGDFVGKDGRQTSGEIIRAGRFTAYYRLPDKEVGFLRPEADGRRLIAVTGEAPGSFLKAVRARFENKSEVLPVDPSGGAVFTQMAEKTDLWEQFELGGIVMWPILIVAVLALVLMIERGFVLGTTKANTDSIMDRLTDLALKGKWRECKTVCDSHGKVPTCRMLNSAMKHVGESQDVVENALQEGILREMPRLERFLPTLAVLAAIAPLLGLLGTVTGMINVFRVITAVGTGDPRMMSSGISEALLTTEFGLAVAIPIMIIHHLLERRVNRIAGDMEEKGTAFAVALLKGGVIRESEETSAG